MTAVLVKEFHTDFHHIEIFSGYPLFTSGIGALLASVGSRLWGKRPAYLVCSALTFASTVWSAKVTSLNSFLGARLVQGFGLGAFEGVVLSTIGDMYFVSSSDLNVSELVLTSKLGSSKRTSRVFSCHDEPRNHCGSLSTNKACLY